MSQLLTSARFTIEVLPTGYMQPYYIIRTLNPVLLEFDIRRFRTVLRWTFDITALTLMLFSLARETKILLRTRPITRYLLDWSNIIEIVHLGIQLWFFALWYGYVLSDTGLANFDVSNPSFVSYLKLLKACTLLLRSLDSL